MHAPAVLDQNATTVIWIILTSAFVFLVVVGLVVFFLAKAGEKKKNRTIIQVGTARGEAEKALGQPVSESETPEGNRFCVYDQGGGATLNIEYDPDGKILDISTSSDGLPNS